MTNISISEEIATACPDLHVLALSCDVCNSEPDERLWQEIKGCPGNSQAGTNQQMASYTGYPPGL